MKRWIAILLLVLFTVFIAVPAIAEAQEGTTWSVDVTPLFQAIIAVIAAVITGKLVPWIKSKTTAQQQDYLQAVVSSLVYAAEQIYGASNGDAKLAYVEAQLKAAGIDIDFVTIKNMIEAEVLKLRINQGQLAVQLIE